MEETVVAVRKVASATLEYIYIEFCNCHEILKKKDWILFLGFDRCNLIPVNSFENTTISHFWVNSSPYCLIFPSVSVLYLIYQTTFIKCDLYLRLSSLQFYYFDIINLCHQFAINKLFTLVQFSLKLFCVLRVSIKHPSFKMTNLITFSKNDGGLTHTVCSKGNMKALLGQWMVRPHQPLQVTVPAEGCMDDCEDLLIKIMHTLFFLQVTPTHIHASFTHMWTEIAILH